MRWDEEVDGSFAILDLKALLSESCDIATEHQRLVYKGRVLQDALTLDDSGMHRPSHLVPGSPLPKPCAQTLCPAAPFLMPTAAPLPPSPIRRERRWANLPGQRLWHLACGRAASPHHARRSS